jgi:FkbM family methyltransferase
LRLFGVEPRGVLHIGAHEAEERQAYADLGWGPTIWVEMLPDKAAALRERFRDDPANVVIEAACWSDEHTITVYRASNGQSSSLLRPARHLKVHSDVTFEQASVTVITKRLDTLVGPDTPFDFINVDTQGAELEVLRGMGTLLAKVRWAYLEINERELYAGCALLPEVDGFMRAQGFVRAIRLMVGRTGWGDALYVRRDDPSSQRVLARARLFHLRNRVIHPGDTPRWDSGV